MYVHQSKAWPHFTWDGDALLEPLAHVRHKQGVHLGRMQSLGFALRSEASLAALTDDVVKSSAIEAERLNPTEVRSSVARRLGLDVGGLVPSGPYVDGVVEMMLDATQRHDAPLTADRLQSWQAALFPTGRSGLRKVNVGAWREPSSDPMQVVSGGMGKETVHFEAPPAARVPAEMAAFLAWFAAPSHLDLVIRAGLAHFWFITIHPFEDGNGRVARAISDMALCHADGSGDRFYSMSSAIEARKQDYYRQLEASQRGSVDVTAWLAWFLACLEGALDDAGVILGSVMHKAAVWRQVEGHGPNPRQRVVLERLLDPTWEGHLTTAKHAKLAKCSTDTALRDVRELMGWGVVVQNPGGGRSTSYRLASAEELEATADRS